MKKIFLFTISLLIFPILFFCASTQVNAAQTNLDQPGLINYLSGAIAIQITGADSTNSDQFSEITSDAPMSIAPYLAGRLGKDGTKTGLLPIGAKYISMLYDIQPSGREYVADLLNNIGIPSVSSAYAQGTGYKAMNPFLPFWKMFRNLAYSLYIIMFVVIGIMIMLRTKVNAQTIITIQSALPNLLITLLLITFSYAIVGFMIDIMYFLIYFIVYLFSSTGVIGSPVKAIDRLLSYSAWSVVFEGRNSIISAISLAIGEVLSGLGTGMGEVVGTLVSWVSFPYIISAVAFAIAMIKLMVALIKSYVMLIVQTITAPVQILMNAIPGSKSFSTWLKTTASYLIPFPVAAAMFIFAAILIGDPTKSTIFQNGFRDANPFGIDANNPLYEGYGGLYKDGTGSLWVPPFTLGTGNDLVKQDILTIIGFVVFLMTPAAVKMAQDWMQVKESPYTAEAVSSLGTGLAWGTAPIKWGVGQQMHAIQEEKSARLMGRYISGKGQNHTEEAKS